ncbi:MAG: pyridoxal phosphate-dependent aminotransferase [Clostridia bacterium]|nr:pyridoxal phosphate-dependent aminotransferase [Clostridia bacterium]
MSFDFNSVPDRRNTGSYKWICTENGGEFEGAFPFSTADMEWGTAPAIRKACSDFAMNGFYCYTVADEHYRKVVGDFMARRHNWNIQPEWIITTYGIVSAIHTCVKAFTKEGEGVIIQSPVYGHFEAAVRLNNRKVVNNALVIKDGKYEINFEELEKMCADNNNKLLILCSPHNPVGRVWDRAELEKLAEIAIKHDITIVSDEIHFDITSKRHTVLASISPEIASRVVTCTAPSKTFNIAGLGTSNIIISDDKLREIFAGVIKKDGYECINAFGYPAIMAAYTECDEWLDEMNARIAENYKVFREFVKNELPEIRQFELEGTYLVWLDVSCLGIPDDKIAEFFAKEAGIVVNSGGWFGDEGLGFIRLNIAGPKEALEIAMNGLRKIFKK